MTVTAALSACHADSPTIEAITRPSANVVLKFTRPGLIGKVMVKDGDAVKAGQGVVQLDNEAELMQVAQLKAQAEDLTRVEASQAQLDQKLLDLKKYDQGDKNGIVIATKMEIEHAKLDVIIARLSLKLAKFTQAQDKRKYEEADVRLSRMTLVSPIDGTVEDLAVEQGESVAELEEVLRVVKIDPLWINVAVPMAQARTLSKGGRAMVTFPGPGRTTEPAAGKIIHMPSEADAGSNTLKVRVEVPNPTARRAGERVKVSFTSSGKSTSAAQTTSRRLASSAESFHAACDVRGGEKQILPQTVRETPNGRRRQDSGTDSQ